MKSDILSLLSPLRCSQNFSIEETRARIHCTSAVLLSPALLSEKKIKAIVDERRLSAIGIDHTRSPRRD